MQISFDCFPALLTALDTEFVHLFRHEKAEKYFKQGSILQYSSGHR